jgi:uncharacterized protein (TIGR02118 family)
MYKMVVLYNTPTDPEHFRSYYEGKHLPLASTLPGLKAWRYSFDTSTLGPPGTPAPYFCVFEGEWDSKADFEASVGSEIGGKVGADVPNYASGGATILTYDVK